MMLAANSVISPPGNSTSYHCISSIRFSWDLTIELLSATCFWHLASCHLVPSWEQYPCIYILIPPLRGHLWFFIQHGEHLSILQFVLIWIIMGGFLHSQFNQVSQLNMRTKLLVYSMNKLYSALHCSRSHHFGSVLSTWTYERPDTVFFNDFCCRGWTNIYAWAHVSTQSEVVIGV